jgi:hypothetical protein
MSGWRLPLAPTSDPDVFISDPGSDFSGDNVVFRRLADGRVTSVLLMDSTFARLDRVAASEAGS